MATHGSEIPGTRGGSMIAAGIFIISAVLIIYHHALYPVLLSAMARSVNAKRMGGSEPVAPVSQTICMIVPAYNEERFIAAKIENCDSTLR